MPSEDRSGTRNVLGFAEREPLQGSPLWVLSSQNKVLGVTQPPCREGGPCKESRVVFCCSLGELRGAAEEQVGSHKVGCTWTAPSSVEKPQVGAGVVRLDQKVQIYSFSHLSATCQ